MAAPVYATIGEIAYHLPERVLRNDELAELYPGWAAERIREKTGVRERHVAATNETAADLAFAAAVTLTARSAIDPSSVDFLLFCTQTPDYFLPSSACILQDRLGLPSTCGALDMGQGCSGFVYGLAMAKGLIESGQARRVLLLTADTYSKLIHPMDKSVRTLFGDAGAATLIEAGDSPERAIGRCMFGTDGRGAKQLIVHEGGFREREKTDTELTDTSGNVRRRSNLYMDGAEVLAFTLREVPRLVHALLDRESLRMDDIDHFVFHQGSSLMLEALRNKLKIPNDRFVIDLEDTGNTVSSSLPLALSRLRRKNSSTPVGRCLLAGFGVGYSWAATLAGV
jgi:3-oxoacyl-[acyl-carrier-protein] synthase-3